MLQLSASGFLALGLGSSVLAAELGSFRFVIISDIHSRDERCRPWFRKVVASIRASRPEFCLINGDVCDSGHPDQLAAAKEIFGTLGIPIYATLGNHDYLTDTDHSPFDHAFPNSVNYHFQHSGWQFIGLDSTQGKKVVFTHIKPATLEWLDATLPSLDPAKPTLVCTHFPLGDGVLTRPLNAGEILSRFDRFNLRATFSGHWHGYAERHFDHATVTNSRCGSWWRTNNDGSPQKGYFLCEATTGGDLRHEFHVVA